MNKIEKLGLPQEYTPIEQDIIISKKVNEVIEVLNTDNTSNTDLEILKAQVNGLVFEIGTIDKELGIINTLNTSIKTNVVNAVNEVNTSVKSVISELHPPQEIAYYEFKDDTITDIRKLKTDVVNVNKRIDNLQVGSIDRVVGDDVRIVGNEGTIIYGEHEMRIISESGHGEFRVAEDLSFSGKNLYNNIDNDMKIKAFEIVLANDYNTIRMNEGNVEMLLGDELNIVCGDGNVNINTDTTYIKNQNVTIQCDDILKLYTSNSLQLEAKNESLGLKSFDIQIVADENCAINSKGSLWHISNGVTTLRNARLDIESNQDIRVKKNNVTYNIPTTEVVGLTSQLSTTNKIIVPAINELNTTLNNLINTINTTTNIIGNITILTTGKKDNLVNAINELNAKCTDLAVRVIALENK